MHPRIKMSLLQSGASCRSTLRSCPDPRPRRWPPARQPGGGELSPNIINIIIIMLSLACRVFGSGFLAQQGSLASCEVVVEQSRAQDYSGQQVEVFQV